MSNQITPTDAQDVAVNEHASNLVVVAGAGSGKTHVLVERYLSLLGNNDWPVESLVAITFTEKAAREMRDRVRQRVEEKAQSAQSSGDEIQARRWATHRSGLDRALISTIHSLCALLLRRFPAESAIDPGFEVIEEIDASLLQEKAVSEVLADLDEHEADIYAHYEAQTVVKTLKDLLDKGSAAKDQMEKLPASAEELISCWQSYQQSHRKAALEKLAHDANWRAAKEWVALNEANNSNDKLEAIRAAVASRMPAVQDSNISEARDALGEIAAAIKLNVGAQLAWGGKDRLEEAKHALRTLRERAGAVVEELGPDLGDIDEIAAQMLLLWRQLYHRALDRYQTHKNRRSALDFDDLEQRTRSLLLDRPEVAAHCREEMRHLLVDEFQDTSPVQRDIIYQLAPPDQPGRLFVVGDPKQSIYRFRGADVSLFHAVQGELKNCGGHEVKLSTSFRSHKCLVDSFNAIFSAILGTEDSARCEVTFDAEMLATRPTRKEHGPIIELLLVPQELSDTRDKGDGSDLTKINAYESRSLQAYWIAYRIKEMVDSEYAVWDKQKKDYRPMRYDDVAILFRASTGFPIFEDVFKSTGLRYVTIAGKGYFRRQEVWDLVNLLKALDNPFDDLSLASVLRSPMFALSDETLFGLRQMADGVKERLLPLFRALNASEGFSEEDERSIVFARNVIGKLRELAGRASLLEILQAALQETAYLATLSALPNGQRRRGNVEKLLSFARNAPNNSLADFTARLSKLRDQEARESEALVDTTGAVQLMTVHAAKGLEFPVVVIADASSAGTARPPDGPILPHPTLGYVSRLIDDETGKLGSTASWEWGKRAEMDADIAEEKRVLYVAATRAQDYLIMAGQPTQSRGKDRGSKASIKWLDRCLDALGCDPTPQMDQSEQFQYIERDWGKVRVQWLQSPLETSSSTMAQDAGGEDAGVEQEVREDTFELSLPIREDPLAGLNDLTATGIAEIALDIEASQEALAWNLRFGNKPVWTVARERVEPYVPGRIVGEIAHRALEQWRLPKRTPKIKEVLQAFAWNSGLTDALAVDRAADQAYKLLGRFERSSLCDEMTEAEATRRNEVPFILQRNGRMVHGSIDAMFQRASGRWVVVDFKTDFVEGAKETLEMGFDMHHLIQVGVYAEAVMDLVGETPAVLLHYIRYGQTISVPESKWREQIEKLGW